MLSCLKVRSLAIIDELEIELGPGLNVLTGETGAGKSILVDALGLVLGQKAQPELVRTGAPQAEVEALFDLSDDAALCARLTASGIETDGELVVRRIVQANGRSRAYVNGVLTTQGQLAALAQGLVEVSSQHEHQSLLEASSQLAQLDAFADSSALLLRMAEAHRQREEAKAALAETKATLEGRSQREDFLRYQAKELEELAPQAGEVAALETERGRLRHRERLIAASSGAEEALYARDGSISEEVSTIASKVRSAAELDASLRPLAEALELARAQIEDTARELGAYGRKIALDPGRLPAVEERLHELQRLARKHGVSSEPDPAAGLAAKLAQITAELAVLDGSDTAIAQKEAAVAEAAAEAERAAIELSARRASAAARLGPRVSAELVALGMTGAALTVSVTRRAEGIGVSGWDRVELLIAPNAGEEPRPLRRIASGGELSRTMLALKHALGGPSAAGLSVFDEIDTGVGGRVAEVMGQKIAELGRHHQVLCVTHLAPVAVYADRHIVVGKAVNAGRTHSTMTTLDAAGRVEEIARMLGGITVSDKTRDAARELLDGAARRATSPERSKQRPSQELSPGRRAKVARALRLGA